MPPNAIPAVVVASGQVRLWSKWSTSSRVIAAPGGDDEQAWWSSDPESEEDIFWENEASFASSFADWYVECG